MAGTAEECWVRFRDLLSEMVDKYVPLKRVSKGKTVGRPIWITHKAKKLVSRKHKAYNKYKDSQHPAVKSACKAARVELRNSRRNFEKKLADNIKDDNKSFFAYARSKTKSKVQVGPLTGSDGTAVESVEDTANLFNNYFASVFTSEDTSTIPDPVCTNSEAFIFDLQFTEADVLHVLS